MKENVDKKSYEFWSTQPVPKIDEEISTNEAIEEDIPKERLRQEPYTLPSGFNWDTLNLDDPIVLKELYVLLNENYVEDDDNMFRFDYSPEFLRWALMPPGYLKVWHTGVRITKSSKLVGFISAVPAKIRIIGNKDVPTCLGQDKYNILMLRSLPQRLQILRKNVFCSIKLLFEPFL